MSSLRPVAFECRRETVMPLAEFAEGILILENWESFTGWGPLPGIRSASFEHRTPEIVGTRFRVVESSGDSHAETITAWEPDRQIEITMNEFPRPLSALSTHFIERFRAEGDLETAGRHTIIRSFELHPTRALARPALRLISVMLRRAIDRHSAQVLPAP